ncbi:MAG TPA: 50S ribosomal protein L24 [Clostridiaceae bacterium]|nr:50S ribosomal protein L24 [Clostridiaceae bacterium]
MPNKVHVKKGDTVYILSGKDRGKKGKVLKVIPKDSTVIVEGVNITTKHRKPRGRYQEGGIIHQESPIHSSNVMLVCERCKAPTKVKKDILENGQKVRICKKCNEIIDVIKEGKENE